MNPPPAAGRALRTLGADLARLVVPLACAGCGRADQVLCVPCRRDLGRPPRVVDLVGPVGEEVPVLALAPYVGRVRSVVLAWKSGTRRDLGPMLEEVGRRAGADLAGALADPGGLADPGALAGDAPLLVVPAPSGLGRRLSGRLVVADLAAAVAEGLAEGLAHRRAGEGGAPGAPTLVRVVDLLLRRDGSQAGRDARARSRRKVVAAARLPAGVPVVLVDDVLTTGATLAACERAVAQAGGRVVACLVLAEAPGRRAVAPAPAGVPGGHSR